MWKTLVASIFLGWYFILLAIGLLGWREARKRYFRRNNALTSYSPRARPLEGVSILRPLKGLDPNMYENLETTFKQDYPTYEIIFAVADDDDPCLDIVRMLLDKYPHVDARVTIGEEIVGVNPKINNLMQAYRTAKYDILWVIDSNVSVVPQTLSRSVSALTASPTIGLVHHVPYATASIRDAKFGTHLERAFLNTNHAKMYIALNVLAIDSCVMGKSNLYRRSHVDQISGLGVPLSRQNMSPPPDGPVRGLASMGKYAAEDAKIGHSIWHELGLEHCLDVDVAQNVLGPMTLRGYIERRARWIRVRKAQVLAATILEPLTESVLAGLLACLALHYFTGADVVIMFVIHWCIFLAIDLDVRYHLTGTHFTSNAELGEFILAWMAREILAFPIWAYAIWGSRIVWRGVTYRMLRGGVVERPDRATRHSQDFADGRMQEPLLDNHDH
ncbi:Ceramide glucosyltransferase {ECO:0000250/UniProtKB:Q16739} {ECO:0000269/PubMed:16741577}; AltName: Full=GLCT-1; AltName: Full=Glucosylceramide synthase {ECO:0000303/PubMed:16741577}; Short=GCS {ECO:0000303/PubMed:16741577}; AltName: Full=UDP-glucose ceramide glucosyltransferase; AltName: Full=UDP-glucose:N-acylsphingosine D-glucosyltransferase [Serendipita indica DSM 11827]|nr:Ceramide glucosyltransferase {ECO:0000250/UniProtKB:Q16739} {ECO:0000269/PubMed:16741577}; AltName: Full=GLCT-1; AltName: Full=Glucosylceramide synthase {ECO:0000303/PubMed:16741577}; Short=GCS {ECO:0000303/PubMed:16741577}; AltName: Full=UDP-glucose ceramide glucosyltransferase; AltName: Full=UDP-glucose:N-acylsphingosine D-glucosyltransferase [Serendipita indica DSM 11827]